MAYNREYYQANKDKFRQYNVKQRHCVVDDPLTLDEYLEGQMCTLKTPKQPLEAPVWLDDDEPNPLELEFEPYDDRPPGLRTVATTVLHDSKEQAASALTRLSQLAGLKPFDGKVYQTARAWYMQAVPA